MSQAWPCFSILPIPNSEDLELQISETHRAESWLGFLTSMAWALASGLESSTQWPPGPEITTLRSYPAGDEGTWNEGVKK